MPEQKFHVAQQRFHRRQQRRTREPKTIVLTAPTGTGKSTVLHALRPRFGETVTFLERDDFADRLGRLHAGHGKNEQEIWDLSFDYWIDAINAETSRGRDVITAATLTRKEHQRLLERSHVPPHLICVLPLTWPLNEHRRTQRATMRNDFTELERFSPAEHYKLFNEMYEMHGMYQEGKFLMTTFDDGQTYDLAATEVAIRIMDMCMVLLRGAYMSPRSAPKQDLSRQQLAMWDKEHRTAATMPAVASHEPSTGVVNFADRLHGSGRPTNGLRVIDIGAGPGRNAIYLAKEHGMEVWAFEYSQFAVNEGQRRAYAAGNDRFGRSVGNRVHYLRWPIDTIWPVDDNFFDVAIDNFSAASELETPAALEVYRDEMFRTLKPGSLALVTVYDGTDEFEAQARVDNPGSNNSAYWPNGKLQNSYDPAGIRELYEGFDILELQQVRKMVPKFGADRPASTHWVVLQKPSEPLVLPSGPTFAYGRLEQTP